MMLIYRGEHKLLSAITRRSAPGSFVLLSKGLTHYKLSGPLDGKLEHLLSCRLATREAAKIETLEYITFYNADRLHSKLGYKSPMEFEQIELLKVA